MLLTYTLMTKPAASEPTDEQKLFAKNTVLNNKHC